MTKITAERYLIKADNTECLLAMADRNKPFRLSVAVELKTHLKKTNQANAFIKLQKWLSRTQ